MNQVKTTVQFITSDNRRQPTARIIFINSTGHIVQRTSRYYGRRSVNQTPNPSLHEGIFKKTIKGFLNDQSPLCIVADISESKRLTLAKNGRTYFINGEKISFNHLSKLLTMIILKMNKYTDSEEIDDDILDFLETPIEINDAVINKIKYKFITEAGDVEETLLEIEKISSDSVAIQFYTDIWVEMNHRQAVMFIRACNGGSNKYSAIPYQELYHLCTGEYLTNSQEKVIEAFMIQNKSSTLVTKRSMELVEKLHKTFPNVYPYEQLDETGSKATHRGLYVRGPGTSWIITHGYADGQHVLGRQNVQTCNLYHAVVPTNAESWIYKLKEKDADFSTIYRDLGIRNNVTTDGINIYCNRGSICIDQMDTNISLGDQIASRVMVFINDKNNINTVSTLRGYEKEFDKPRNKEVLKDGMLSLRPINITPKIAIKWLKGEQLL